MVFYVKLCCINLILRVMFTMALIGIIVIELLENFSTVVLKL